MGCSTSECSKCDGAADPDDREGDGLSFDTTDEKPKAVGGKRRLESLDSDIAARLAASVSKPKNLRLISPKSTPKRLPKIGKSTLRDDVSDSISTALASPRDPSEWGDDEVAFEGQWMTSDGRRYIIEQRARGLVFCQNLEASGRQVEGLLAKFDGKHQADLQYLDDGGPLGSIRLRVTNNNQTIESSFRKHGQNKWRASTPAFRAAENGESEAHSTSKTSNSTPASCSPTVDESPGRCSTAEPSESIVPWGSSQNSDSTDESAWPAVPSRFANSVVEELEGWLLKMKSKNRPGGMLRLASPLALTSAQSVFWKRRYFSVTADSLSYWVAREEFDCSSMPTGTFALRDVDEVTVNHMEIAVHFAGRQRTGAYDRARESLNLRAQSIDEAARWGSAIRVAAAAQLRMTTPSEWDTHAMLGERTGPVRMVSKVPLPISAMVVVQRLLDHSFVCKRTRDRSGDVEVPLRLDVAQVTRVQNSVAWRKYSMAVDRMRVSFGPDGERLQPEVLTATHDDSGTEKVLGELCEDAHERWLFHGTTSAAVQGIADRDFLMDLAGTHRGTLYGKGVYLAECSSKADEYAEEDEDGLCTMLICRVVLGRVLVDTDKKPGADLVARTKAGYDSLCGDRWAAVGTFREFILYDSRQVYPAYIVHYRRTKQADILRAIGVAAERNDMKSGMELIPHVARLTETHPDPVVRYRIIMLLGAHTGMAVRALTKALSDERRQVRKTSAGSLGQLGAQAASKLARSVDPTDDAARKTMAALAVPALTLSLRDSCQEVRCAAAVALEQFGPHAASAVRELQAALSDAHPSVKTAAATAIAQLGTHATPAVPALVVCLGDEVAGVRTAAARALGELGSVATPTVTSLLECLGDSDHGVRQAAATALGNMAQNSPAAVEALSDRLSDAEVEVRAAATKALGQLGATSKVKALTQCLKDASSEVRTAAATALGQLGSQAAPCVPALIECLKDPGDDVRTAATASLGLLGPHAPAAVPALIHKSLKDMSDEVRTAGAVALEQLGALGQFGNNANSAETALTERLKDPCEAVRKASSAGLMYYREASFG